MPNDLSLELFQRVVVLATRSGFTFDTSVGRYRDLSTGQFVSESVLVDLIENYSSTFVQENVSQITDDLLSGKITLDSWEVRIAQELKEAYVVSASIGRGGRGLMEMSDWGRIGGHLRFEYRHLDQFAQEIKSGSLSAAQIKFRAQMYADGVRTAFWDGRRASKVAAGMVEERRVLTPAEHCPDCIDYANQSWVVTGTLPPPGSGSRCLHSCKCLMEFREASND